ncbi:hypothetical protein [Tissierella praeacuta]|uniref:hypothetical protein n=1 Tax=Tissierella praeacuta TaxID=43131 RepID=UPI00333FB270
MSYKKQSKITACLSMAFILLFLFGATYVGTSPIQKGTNSTHAPDNIPVNTKKSDIITQIDNPNVDITIDNNAAVELVSTTDNELTVNYGGTLYNVDISNENVDLKIHISYIGNYSKYPAAVLYIPMITYGDINIQIEQATAYFNGVFQNSRNINANIESSSIFYTIPTGFTGKLNATAPDSYLELRSNDGYKNCDINISNFASSGNIANGFTKQGNSLIYNNGTQVGVINIDFEDGGYVIIE